MAFKHSLTIVFCSALLMSCGGGSESGSEVPKVDTAPVLAGTPISQINEDEAYSFQITVTNTDRDPLTFSLANHPSWLSVSNSGLLEGTPMVNSDAGQFDGIVVSARDPAGNVGELTFDLTVTAVNDTPEIDIDLATIFADEESEFVLEFDIRDEEGGVELAVTDESQLIELSVGDGTITAQTGTITEITSGELALTIIDGEFELLLQIPYELSPVSDSGRGRTLKGSETSSGLHLVILGDGYTAEEMSKFREDARGFIDYMYADSGIEQHLSAWNIHMIETPSAESGADADVNEDTVDTYFNAGYNCGGIARLICVLTRLSAETALAEYPNYDEIAMIVNSDVFGGAGGFISIYNRTSPEIAMHEMGHSFADLADEYVDEAIADDYVYVEGQYANVTTLTDPNLVPWANWIDDKSNYAQTAEESGVGIIEGAHYRAEGFYRSEANSKMRSSTSDFGPVNSEQWIVSSYERAGAIKSFQPEPSAFTINAGDSISFSVELMFGLEVQSINWILNDVAQPAWANQETVELTNITDNQSLRVEVWDSSGRIRRDDTSFSEFHYNWTIVVE